MTKAYHYVFQTHHIEKTWDYLEKKFSFNKKKWRERFEDYRKKRPRYAEDEAGAFLKFGNTFINPLLNEILGRQVIHPTFENLTQFILVGKKQK